MQRRAGLAEGWGSSLDTLVASLPGLGLGGPGQGSGSSQSLGEPACPGPQGGEGSVSESRLSAGSSERPQADPRGRLTSDTLEVGGCELPVICQRQWVVLVVVVSSLFWLWFCLSLLNKSIRTNQAAGHRVRNLEIQFGLNNRVGTES